jgi:hypothetical protein
LVLVPGVSLGVIVAYPVDALWVGWISTHCNGSLSPQGTNPGGPFCSPENGVPSDLAWLVALAVPGLFGLAALVGLIRGARARSRVKLGLQVDDEGCARSAMLLGGLGLLLSCGTAFLVFMVWGLSNVPMAP